MVKIEPKTIKMITTTEEEIMEKLVKADHPFRKLNKMINFEELIVPYRKLYSDIGVEGVDVIKGFKALLIQFWENYSDREMERVLGENVAVKWFCGFELTENTPDHSYFGKLRKRLGTKSIANIFNSVNEILRSKGLFGDMFKFIDASAIVTKTALWKERDRAIKEGEEKLNNKNVKNYAADKDARWGAKSKNNIWFGYKRHCNVDMRYGLIDKLAVTPANIPDQKMLENICPKNCMVFMDKIYDTKKSNQILQINNCASGIIRKNNNKTKNKNLDSWRGKIRMPFESTFSKLNKRTKYRGKVKVLFQCFAESIAYNLKKAIRILPYPIGA
ncbi:MAG: transposase [Patescibacteria group bacterium]